MGVRLQPRPGAGRALDQVDDHHRVHGAFDGHPARLALTLAGVPVTERGTTLPWDADLEVAGHPGPHLRRVHVAAVRVRDERGPRLQVRWCHPDRAVHRVHRKVHRVLTEPGLEAAQPIEPVELIDPHHLGQRFLQARRGMGRGQRPEQRDRAGRGPVPGRLDGDEMDRQRVAWLRCLDVGTARSCGFTYGNSMTTDARSPIVRTRPRAWPSHEEFERRARCDASHRGHTAERPGVVRRSRSIAQEPGIVMLALAVVGWCSVSSRCSGTSPPLGRDAAQEARRGRGCRSPSQIATAAARRRRPGD